MSAKKNKPVKKIIEKPLNRLVVVFNAINPTNAQLDILSQLKPVDGIKWLLLSENELNPDLTSGFETMKELDILRSKIDQIEYENLLYIELDKLNESANVQQLIQYIQKNSSGKNARIEFKQEGNLIKNVFAPVLLFSKKYFQELISTTISNTELSYHLNAQLNQELIDTDGLEVNQEPIYDKPGYPNVIKRIRYWIHWLISEPLTDIKTKGWSFERESSIHRLLFTAFATLTFVLMTVFCFDAGNSGDEITLIRQAEKSYDFFATLGKDKSAIDKQGRDPMYAYGQSFDLVTYAISKWFNIDDLYSIRHLFNTWLGWLAMLFTGLLAVSLMGWRAGFLTFVFIALSPRFLGHSWNNPKDIPFAFGFIFTLYFAFRFIKHLPRVSIRNLIFIALGFAFTNSIRIGGLLLIAYIGLFILTRLLQLYGLGFLTKNKHLKFTFNLAKIVLLFLAGGYFLGILLWPFALLNPIKNPLEALNLMTNFKISLRQLFEGEIVWSDNLPWYYALKYMLYTIPIFIFTGLFFSFINLKKVLKNVGNINFLLLLFIWIFPIFYTIYKDSNLYGGWRHLIFSYPPLVILAATGFENLYNLFNKKYFKYAITAVIIALMIKPAIHTFKYHPYQYVYYNEISGGMKEVWGEYELDYYFHSFKEAADWLIENELKDKFDKDHKIIVRTNAGAKYHFRKYTDYVNVSYMRYYERGDEDWDYALIVNTYINPRQLKADKWPPTNTIHTIDIDGYPICAILKRKTKEDLEAYKAMKAGDYANAISLYNEALEITPDNESALLNLAQIYQSLGQLKPAEQTIKKCLNVYPDYDRALAQLGVVYLSQGQLNNAAKTFTRTIQVNKKYGPAYYYMGLIYQNAGDITTAMNYANQALEHSPRLKPAYILLSNLLKAQGRNQEAERVLQIANTL